MLGKTIGNYTIAEQIGVGGMGEVYRATDSRLGRDVAVKIIPPEFAGDPERLSRFEREARLLASLNHPNVAAVHGLETEGDINVLVMELIPGDDLAVRIGQGPVPVGEALDIMRQVAEGLGAAHNSGILHRDLKPANIKVTPDGTAKVLDFGLAKSDPTSSGAIDLTQSPTITHDPTQAGVILGTAAYMSPEQARGKPTDRRADVWAFGTVLFELLTGERLFGGETVSDTLAAVLRKEPEWETLPSETPRAITHLLKRCLERDPRRRLQDIGEARITIEKVQSGEATTVETTTPEQKRSGPNPWRIAALLVIVIGTGAAGFLFGKRAMPQPEPERDRFEIPIRQAPTFNVGRPAISPDGTMIAYLDQGRVWIRHLDSFDAREVEGSEHGETPFWSPDSAWLGFGRGAELVKVSAEGGRPTMITRAQSSFSIVGGAQWSKDDRIFFATGDAGIYEVSANGGEPRLYVPLERPDDDDFHELALMPDGKTLVFTVHSRTRPWYLAISDGTERRELISFDHHGIMTPAYSPTGHILFHRFGEEHSVWALPFSEETMETTGPPFIVSMDDGNPHVSRNGTLVMTRRIVGIEGGDLIKFTPESGDINVLFDPAGQYYDPALSPDGSTLAVAGFDLGAVDIWLIDFASGQHTRLTYDESTKEVLPRWSPDGKVIAYAKTTGSTYERVGPDDSIHFVATDGSGETRDPIEGGWPTFDAKWKFVVLTRLGAETGLDLYALSLDGSSESTPILDSPATEQHPALSPDGEFLAYVSDESGQQAVYVTRFPSGEGKWQVSTELGSFPVWSRDGRRLYFAGSTVNVLEVEFSREGRIMIGQPRMVMDGPTLGINPYSGFSFAPDDQSLLMIRPRGKSEPPAIGVVKNWFEEFRDR